MDAAFVNFICKGRILLYFREIWLLFNKKVLSKSSYKCTLLKGCKVLVISLLL